MTDRPHLLALDYIASIDDPIRVTDDSGNPHLHYSAQHVKAAFAAGVLSWGTSRDGQAHALLCDVLRHLTDDVGVVSYHMADEDQRTFYALTDRIRAWLVAEADDATPLQRLDAATVERAFKAGWDKCWQRDPDAPAAVDGGRHAAWEAYRDRLLATEPHQHGGKGA